MRHTKSWIENLRKTLPDNYILVRDLDDSIRPLIYEAVKRNRVVARKIRGLIAIQKDEDYYSWLELVEPRENETARERKNRMEGLYLARNELKFNEMLVIDAEEKYNITKSQIHYWIYTGKLKRMPSNYKFTVINREELEDILLERRKKRENKPCKYVNEDGEITNFYQWMLNCDGNYRTSMLFYNEDSDD